MAPLRYFDAVALATLILAYIAWNTDKTLHDTLVAANRAWLAPIEARMLGQPTLGVPLTYDIIYGNVGKEPALGFVAQEDVGIIDVPPPLTTLYSVFPKTLLRDICSRTKEADDSPARYPSALRDYIYRVSTEQIRITQEILDGSKAIYVNGCFAYKTFGRERKSEYCFIFLPASASGERTFRSVSCPYGNRAY